MHNKCRDAVLASSMSFEQKNQCVMCRTKYPESNKEIVEQLRPWVEKGKAWAQSELGHKYYYGLGVDQSYQHSKVLFELAAIQGHVSALLNLGLLYAQGQGVEKSYVTAREWWTKSAEQGNETAINILQKLDKIEGRTTPSFIPKHSECATCFRPHDPPEHKLRPCKRCHRVYYCGRECQAKHWKMEGANGHKQKCTSWRQRVKSWRNHRKQSENKCDADQNDDEDSIAEKMLLLFFLERNGIITADEKERFVMLLDSGDIVASAALEVFGLDGDHQDFVDTMRHIRW